MPHQNEIVSETNYYPFGLAHKGYNEHVSSSNLGQKYKFNGKELNDEFGLNFTDFGWRNYMSDIGRWISPDPLMEEYPEWSPYNFTMNNPVRYIDPDGLSVQRWEDRPEILAQKARIETAMEEYYGIEGNASNENESKNSSSEDGDKPIGKNYKGKTQTAPATPLVDENGNPNTDAYNCHSYAWCNSLGDPKDPANQNLVKYGITKWDNDPTNNTGGYTPLQFDDPNHLGDRVIYYAWNKQSGKVEPTHSAIVTKVDKQGNTILVESKWGQAPRYQHHPRDIPTSYGATTPTFVAPDGKTYASRIYFRKNP